MKKFLVSMIVGLALNSAAFADDVQAVSNLTSAKKSLLCVFPQLPQKPIKVNVPLTETGTLAYYAAVYNADSRDTSLFTVMDELNAGERFNIALAAYDAYIYRVRVSIAPYPDKKAAPSVTGPWAATFDNYKELNVAGSCSIDAE